MLSKKPFLLILITFYFLNIQAQFEFSGEVSDEFINSTVYLSIVDDYKKSSLFLTNSIIQESIIDNLGRFNFKGDFGVCNCCDCRTKLDSCTPRRTNQPTPPPNKANRKGIRSRETETREASQFAVSVRHTGGVKTNQGSLARTSVGRKFSTMVKKIQSLISQ